MQARAASGVLKGFMGWKHDVDAHIQELRSGQGLTYSIQKMLWKLDRQHKIESKIQPYDLFLNIYMEHVENKTFAEFYFSIPQLCRMRSRHEMLQFIRQEYLQNRKTYFPS